MIVGESFPEEEGLKLDSGVGGDKWRSFREGVEPEEVLSW